MSAAPGSASERRPVARPSSAADAADHARGPRQSAAEGAEDHRRGEKTRERQLNGAEIGARLEPTGQRPGRLTGGDGRGDEVLGERQNRRAVGARVGTGARRRSRRTSAHRGSALDDRGPCLQSRGLLASASPTAGREPVVAARAAVDDVLALELDQPSSASRVSAPYSVPALSRTRPPDSCSASLTIA